MGKLEPWFQELKEKYDKWQFLIDMTAKVRKFKSDNKLSQTSYIDITFPMTDLLKLDGCLQDFVGSQGVVKINIGDFKIEKSGWQNE